MIPVVFLLTGFVHHSELLSTVHNSPAENSTRQALFEIRRDETSKLLDRIASYAVTQAHLHRSSRSELLAPYRTIIAFPRRFPRVLFQRENGSYPAFSPSNSMQILIER